MKSIKVPLITDLTVNFFVFVANFKEFITLGDVRLLPSGCESVNRIWAAYLS